MTKSTINSILIIGFAHKNTFGCRKWVGDDIDGRNSQCGRLASEISRDNFPHLRAVQLSDVQRFQMHIPNI